MKTKVKLTSRSTRQNWFRRTMLAASVLAVAALSTQNVGAVDVLWNAGAGSWTNTANWTGGVVPTSTSNAVFNTSLITGNPNITVNVSPASTLQAGSITVGDQNASNFRLTAQSTAVNPTTLNLNGVGGILISNYSPNEQIIITNSTGGNLLNLGLGGNGMIYANNGTGQTPPADSSGGEVVIYTSITGTGSITNVGGGILYFWTNNTYSGSTTLSAGALELASGATLGDGTGTLYFSGGNLEDGGSSTTRIIANPIMVNVPSSGNAYIYNKTGTAGTRVMVFSGSLGWTSGTLVIGNVDVTLGEYFDVELRGTFTTSLPLVVGDNFFDAYSDNYPSDYSELQLVNTNGTQTFNGIISGDGPIIRGNLSNVAVPNDSYGTTIFTGNNTYTGGTTITNGTLFANNTAGSALGTGPVTVGGGVLGGNGAINSGAAVSIYSGGKIMPGSATNTIGTLAVGSGLTFNPGAIYTWQISSVAGTPGTAWDLIDASGGGWTDSGSSSPTININVTSQGVPTGWNSATNYSWMIITNNGGGTSFNASHWTVGTAGYGGTVAGAFGVTTDGNGDLLLTYTPTAGSVVIAVDSGSVNQGGVSPTPYPFLTGTTNVIKVGNGEVVMTNTLNNYVGQTFIDAGTASAAVNSTTAGGAFGSSLSPLVLGNTTGASSNATLNIDQPGVLIANAVTVQSGNAGTKTIGTTITSGAATNSGNVTLNDNVTLSAASGGSDLFSGNFGGTGGITFAGGTITMSGLGSYAGATTAGNISLNLNSSALGTNTFTINNGVILDNTSRGSATLANNPPQNWNADFTFTGTTNLNLGAGPVTMSANRILTVNNSVLTVGGTIAGTGFGLTKSGAGELSLAGATTNSYTGGTTNLGGTLAINGTATFGDGTGPLVLSGGGNLLDTGTRSGFPVSNPVQMNTSTRVYGNSTDTSVPNRYMPFTGVFTVTGGSTLYIDNVGSATTIFNLSLQGSNYTTINWPVMIGDPGFDTSGALTVLNLINDNTTPVQTISSLISGIGSIIRGASALNTGGTTILTQQNTFSGGVALDSGAIGLGASSITNGGGIVSGPLGTGQFTFGASTTEASLTVFATVPNVEIDNHLFFNGDTNMVFAGSNNMLFTGNLNSGGVAKTITVTNGITVTFSGAITNTGSSTGGALTKAGGGILVLSGTSAYTGTNTVNAGTLLVNGSVVSNVTANSVGTLGGTGTIGGNATFASGAQAYLYKTASSPDSPLTVSGNLTLNGNAVNVDLGGTTTLGVGSYRLINYTGTLSSSFNATPVIVNGSLAGGTAATIDVSTPNQVNLIVATSGPGTFTNPPGATSFSLNGLNIVITGTNGQAGDAYYLLESTNVALLRSQWKAVATNVVNANGNFTFTGTNVVTSGDKQQFYILSNTNSNP